MQQTRVNWLAVLVCVILHMLLGGAWYSVWGLQWMELSHVTMLDSSHAGPMPYVEAVVCAILVAVLLSYLLPKLGAMTFGGGLKWAFLISAVFVFASGTVTYAFSLRPFELSLIDHLYPLISFSLMGGIVAAWRRKAKA